MKGKTCIQLDRVFLAGPAGAQFHGNGSQAASVDGCNDTALFGSYFTRIDRLRQRAYAYKGRIAPLGFQKIFEFFKSRAVVDMSP